MLAQLTVLAAHGPLVASVQSLRFVVGFRGQLA
jgi:hypothetical protein